MRVPRVQVARLEGDQLDLSPEVVHHLVRVLRLRRGDEFLASDGSGRQVRARVTAERPLQAVVLEECRPDVEPAGRVWLFLGLCKGERFDRAVEKACELGVARITPVVASRGQVKDPGPERQNRWRRLASSASALAGRTRVPEVTPPWELGRVLAEVSGPRWLFTRGADPPSESWNGSLSLLIGPEGGFEPGEVEQARAAGWELAGLGSRNLRVETAATAALTLALYLGGELKGDKT